MGLKLLLPKLSQQCVRIQAAKTFSITRVSKPGRPFCTFLGYYILVMWILVKLQFTFLISVGIPQLVQLLKSDNEEVKEAAALALANLTTCNLSNAKYVQRCSLNSMLYGRSNSARCARFNILAFKKVYIFF